MELQVRHLELILAVADEGSVSSAARALHLSQPATSAQLSRIEAHLGSSLFDRHPTGCLPTPRGHTVISRARRAIGAIDAIEDSAEQGRQTSALRIGGFPSSYFSAAIADMVGAFEDRHVVPRSEASSARLTALLRRGEIDLAVLAVAPGRDFAPPTRLRQTVMVERQPLLLAVSSAGPHAHRSSISFAELENEAWLLPPGPLGGGHLALAEAFSTAGYAPRAPFGQSMLLEYPDLVSGGYAVAIACPTTPVPPGVTMVPFARGELFDALVVRWRPTAVGDRVAADCLDAFRRCYSASLLRISGEQRWWRASPWARPGLAPLSRMRR